MKHSTRAAAGRKRKSPLPLTLRRDGRYCKKVHGKIHYFAGPSKAALEEWLRVKDELLAGHNRPIASEGVTVGYLCDAFRQSLEQKHELGEISGRHLNNCKWAMGHMVAAWKLRTVESLTAKDFADFRAKYATSASKKTPGVPKSPVSVGSLVRHARMVFRFGMSGGESALLKKPVDFGDGFKGPSKKVRRKFKREKGKKLFEAAELRRILRAAPLQLKTMILLGLNCGFGNSDCGTLPIDSLDLAGGWCTYHRPKTEIERRCKLWPETVKRLKAVLASRKEPKDDADKGLVFITKYGDGWAKDDSDNPISKAFRKILNALELHRPGLGFYTLRHVFRTVAGGAKDVEATRAIMGHTNDHVESDYIESVDDARLEAVANVVRKWLFAAA